MSRCTVVGAATLVVLGCVLTATAGAATFGTTGYVQGRGAVCPAYPCSTDYTYDSLNGPVGNVTVSTSPTYSHYTGSGGSANSTAGSWSTATPGVLHAFAAASTYGGTGYMETTGKATASAGWTDQITITSSTLAVGAPVDLLATVRNEGTFTNSDPAAAGDVFDSALSLYWTDENNSGINGSIVCNSSINDTFGGADPLPCTHSTVIHTYVGHVLDITGSLQASALAEFLTDYLGNVTYPASTATTDFSNTGAALFQMQTAGASFTSASGATYVSTVPLPAAGWLMVSGLVGLGGMARRYRGGSTSTQQH